MRRQQREQLVDRSQRRGGKGIRDIKATQRNGRVVGIIRVDDQDEVLMIALRSIRKVVANNCFRHEK